MENTLRIPWHQHGRGLQKHLEDTAYWFTPPWLLREFLGHLEFVRQSVLVVVHEEFREEMTTGRFPLIINVFRTSEVRDDWGAADDPMINLPGAALQLAQVFAVARTDFSFRMAAEVLGVLLNRREELSARIEDYQRRRR